MISIALKFMYVRESGLLGYIFLGNLLNYSKIRCDRNKRFSTNLDSGFKYIFQKKA